MLLPTNQYRDARLAKLEKIKELGIDPWPFKALRTHGISEILAKYGCPGEWTAERLDQDKINVSVMGRLLSLREMGKSVFGHLSENGHKLQSFFRKNDLEESNGWELLKLLDLGDFISVTGPLMRTKTGELTVRAGSIQFLCKACLPMPEKWHGLQDKEQRYRQRYLDLATNPSVMETFQRRVRILAATRREMEAMGYLEVETPMMQPIAGGAAARPFVTHHNALGIDLYMRIAPELYLKRLIVGGFDKVFEINRNFRNEGLSQKHNPEFTMLECYAAGQDLRDMMEVTERVFHTAATTVIGSETIQYAGHDISYARPFKRLSFKDAISQYGNIDRRRLDNNDEIVKLAGECLAEGIGNKSPGQLLGLLFDRYAEDKLVQPTFIIDHPIELSPLTKELPEQPGFVDRFELFVAGMELANAYSELNDPMAQLQRFQGQLALRAGGDGEAMMLDEDFILSLEHGFPPCGGLGIGIDRMVMLLTGNASIRDVILFPLMRPERPRGEL
jgi:lysyl-tRNA synthetase class 2